MITLSDMRRMLPALVLAVALAGCDDLLDVEQPGLITDEDARGNRALLEAIVNARAGSITEVRRGPKA